MNSYLLFIKNSVEIDGPQDADARQLLDVICLNHAEGHPITVTQAMSIHSIASPATLHRKLDALGNGDWIEHEYKGGNKRTKYLVPTTKAILRMGCLSNVINKWAAK